MPVPFYFVIKMKLISSRTELEKWLITRDLKWDEDWCNIYLPDSHEGVHDRFWILPMSPEKMVFFLDSLIEGLDTWGYIILVKKQTAHWYRKDKTGNIVDAVQNTITSVSGIPRSYFGAIKIKRSEKELLLTLLFNQLLFGYCSWDDVYVIPDHANQIMMTSHHHVVWVTFRDRLRIKPFVKTVTKKGFPLPDKVPDSTFHTPKWMVEQGNKEQGVKPLIY